MNRLRFLFGICIIVFISFACKRSVDYTGAPDELPTIVNPEPVAATLQGNVVDENDLPAAGVTIKAGIKTATTDNKGFFRIVNAPLDKNASLVVAEKIGYFKALRSFGANTGANYVAIKLIKKTLNGTISAATGGSIVLANTSKITLPANGVVLSSTGAAYAGAINVYAAYIDPTSTKIGEIIPGSLMADDSKGSRVALASFGMLAVELESATGQKLQIKTGSKATISAPVPASLQATAPATIAMWHLDEQTGLWEEEGTGTKTAAGYTGEVSHFSFWNFDISMPAVNLTLKVKDGNGAPLVHALVKLTSSTYLNSSYGYTDSLGAVSGLVPANQQLSVQVLNQCYASVFSQALGSFSQPANFSSITVNAATAGSSLVTVQGVLTNCNGNPLNSGYVIISQGSQSRYVSVNATGNFTTTFLQCAGSTGSLQILGIDNSSQQQGQVVTLPVTSPITNAGNVSACGTSSAQFINFTFNGTTYSATGLDSLVGNTQNNVVGYSTFLQAGGGSFMVMMRFNHAAQIAGNYTVDNYIGVFTNTTNASTQGTTNVHVNLTNFPQSLGQFYEGTFSGTYLVGATTHTITNGSFRLRRDN